MPVIPAPRRLRHEYHDFEGSLGYIVQSCLKKKFLFWLIVLKVHQRLTEIVMDFLLAES
jgi:hypothetical protein